MFHHHRFGLAFTAVLGLLATVLLLRQGDEHRLPAGGCIAQLTSLDDARFEQSGEGMRFDGTLLFSDTSLHVEGVLETGSKVFRLNRQILWRESWLSPGRRTLRSNRIYFGDTLPSHIAAQLPLLGEPSVELRFEHANSDQFGVFANEVFFTYCRPIR